MVIGDQEADQEYNNMVFPIKVENTASLVSSEEMNESAAVKLDVLKKELSNVPRMGSECSEINKVDQQSTLVRKRVNDANGVDFLLSELPSANMKVAEDTANNMTEKEFEMHCIASLKNNSEYKVDAKEMLQPLVENPPDESFDTHKKFSCEFCGRKFNKSASVNRHITRVHNTVEDLKDIQGDLTSRMNQQKQKQEEQIALKMEIKVEETILLQQDDFGISTLNQTTTTDCSDLSQNAEDQKVKISVPLSVDSSRQKSALSQEKRTDTHRDIDSNNTTKKKYKVHPITRTKRSETKVMAENSLQPIAENLLSGSSDTKCTDCGKQFSRFSKLTRHIKVQHVPHTCDVCEITFPSFNKAHYHKVKKHTEAKYKCPHCPKKHHTKKNYRTHLSSCGRKKFSCELCDQKFNASEYVIVRHMRNVHNIKGSLKKDLIDRIRSNEEHKYSNVEKIGLKKEISVEETTSNSVAIIGCPICGEQFCDQIQVSHHVDEIHQMTMCVSCGMTFASADLLKDHKLSCHQHLKHINSQFSSEEISQPHGETSSNGLSNTVCPHCDKDCCYVALLAYHIVRCHQPAVCDICGVTVTGKHRMTTHKRNYHLQPKFKCPHCSKICSSKSNYLRHVSSHVPESKFPCKLCSRKYKSALAIKDHMKRMHGLKGYQTDRTDCNELNRESQPCNDVNLLQGENMELTMEIKVEETTLQEQEYEAPNVDCGEFLQPSGETSLTGLSDTVCPHCDKDCCHEPSLAIHIAWCHQPVVCATCGVTVSGKNRMKYHKTKYHSEPKFKCPHCSKLCSNKKRHLRHVSTHLKESKYPCKLCDRKFKNVFAVKDHMIQKHNMKEYQTDRTDCNELEQEHQPCDDVGLIQDKKMELKTEIQEEETTLQDQEYQALDESRVKSTTITILNDSQSKPHKNIIPDPRFKCSECDKPFLEQYALRKHMAVHSKTKGGKHSLDGSKRRRTDAKGDKPTSDDSSRHVTKEKR